MKQRRILLCLLVWSLTLPAVFAQVDTGTIAGSVRDSQGAGVPAATVTFVETGTNTTTKTQTNGSGDYASPPLRPGSYKITAAAPGFKTETRGTLVVQLQDRLRLDFAMAVGSVSENVEVTAETPAIQTDTSSLGEVVSTKEMTQLPLNGRDYIQLATLTTGVVRTSSGTNGNTGGSSTGGLNSFVANGTRGTLNNFLLDGIDNNSNDNGGVVLRRTSTRSRNSKFRPTPIRRSLAAALARWSMRSRSRGRIATTGICSSSSETRRWMRGISLKI
jgi:hypothetical protein